MYTSIVQPGPHLAPLLPMQRSRLILYKVPTLLPPTSYLLFSVLSSFHHVLGCSSIPPTSSSDSLRALQCNARGLLATSAELLHYISLHPVDFICVENAILNWSSSFRLLCNLTALSPNDPHASGGVNTFAKQGLPSELSTSFSLCLTHTLTM